MKYLKILYVQVLIGIVLGILVGYLVPSFSGAAKIIADMYINLIRMVIAPVIFACLVLGMSGAGEMKKVGRIGGKAILYFEIITTFALIIGLVVTHFIQPGTGIPKAHLPAAAAGMQKMDTASTSMDWGHFISNLVPANIVDAFAKGDILQILLFGILFSIGLSKMGSGRQSVIHFFEKLNQVLFNILHLVVKVSPIGAFGGMAYTIGQFGFGSLVALGKLLCTFYLTGLLFIFVALNLIAYCYKFSLWKLLGYIKEEILIVLGTSSSEVVLPNLMEKLQKAGLDKGVVGLVIPAGYSFNLDGTSIYLSMSVIFLAQVFHVPLTLGHELGIIAVLLISSKGAAGVTGSGFLVLTSTLAALKIIPIEGLALLIGVDRFMSEGRAIVNVIGNSVATVVIAKSEKAIEEPLFKHVVEHRPLPAGYEPVAVKQSTDPPVI
ncbi:aerobic C4-dicarboxylate transport protein [Arachidicoccus rhizosphaerae]|uniref:Aerobic C4-dicarboxylate transport protein n=1 Tax=Arachidicoccus rhizosphaerae TaxID=551991 RepID=A0A1H4AEC4_9BACT|nr:C4-dicarboxylate transporter DctA [Arachidicoccus rhizosphaerae]SEA34329.1 aerobic C4-dicarboxylate transport protein [Arachidicoccus rhizosphaerae]